MLRNLDLTIFYTDIMKLNLNLFSSLKFQFVKLIIEIWFICLFFRRMYLNKPAILFKIKCVDQVINHIMFMLC